VSYGSQALAKARPERTIRLRVYAIAGELRRDRVQARRWHFTTDCQASLPAESSSVASAIDLRRAGEERAASSGTQDAHDRRPPRDHDGTRRSAGAVEAVVGEEPKHEAPARQRSGIEAMLGAGEACRQAVPRAAAIFRELE